jgi:hypothetical protein
VERCQLFVPAANVGIVGELRHLAAMLLALAMIVVMIVAHVRPAFTDGS